MSVIVVHPDPGHECVAHLVELLQELGHPPSIVVSFGAARQQIHSRSLKTIVVVPDTERDQRLVEKTIAFVESEIKPFVVYVADTIAADAYKRLLRSQRGEWVEWQAAPREVANLIGKHGGHTDSTESAKIVSFLPSKGGVGNTTLALETGICLASQGRKERARVAIVDLNLQGSTLADSLDLEARFDVTEFMNRPERLDDQLIDILTAHYSSNLDVFSSPPRLIRDEELKPEVLFSLLDQLGKRYDFIVLDILHRWRPWSDNILQGSDAVVITGGSTVPAVKQLASRIQHVQTLALPPERVTVVVNQCETDLLGRIPRKADIDKTFSGQRLVYVPLDVATATQAANTGKPMVELAPRRRLCREIRDLAQWSRNITSGPERVAK